MSGDILGCHSLDCYWYQVSRGRDAAKLPAIPWAAHPLPPNQKYLAPDVSSVEVEKTLLYGLGKVSLIVPKQTNSSNKIPPGPFLW